MQAKKGKKEGTGLTKSEKQLHYEFLGPYIGPIGMMVGLPIITFLYARYCDNTGWPMKGFTLDQLAPGNLLNEFLQSWDTKVFTIYVCYWLY